MHGGMPCSRWSVLPEKMILMRRISVPTPIPLQNCRDHPSDEQVLVMGDFRGLRQALCSEHSYRRAFAKAYFSK